MARHVSLFVLETRLSNGEPRKIVRKRGAGERGLRFGDDAGFYTHDGQRLSGARPEIAMCERMVEPVPPDSPMLYLFGAGHVGRAVAHVLKVSAFQTRWFDERLEFQKKIGELHVEPLSEVDLEMAPEKLFVLIMTHSHDRDYELTKAALSNEQIAFCGLIGSKTKRARFLQRLRNDGLTQAQIAKLTCPIGETGLQSKTPGAIAVSAVAQLMSVAESLADNQDSVV